MWMYFFYTLYMFIHILIHSLVLFDDLSLFIIIIMIIICCIIPIHQLMYHYHHYHCLFCWSGLIYNNFQGPVQCLSSFQFQQLLVMTYKKITLHRKIPILWYVRNNCIYCRRERKKISLIRRYNFHIGPWPPGKHPEVPRLGDLAKVISRMRKIKKRMFTFCLVWLCMCGLWIFFVYEYVVRMCVLKFCIVKFGRGLLCLHMWRF